MDSIDKTIIGITTQFPQLSTGLGKMKGEYRIQLSEEVHVVPYSLQTPCRVSIPLLPKFKAELERMETLGVISKIDESTGLCAGMVVVPKTDGRVRICVD